MSREYRTIGAPIRGHEYRIVVGAGACSELRRIVRELSDANAAVIIADETVASLHLPALLATLPPSAITLRVPTGEQNKSLAMAARLYDELAAAHVERRDVLITFGGGMVGDLGGFVAATWLRGLRFIQVPTTLEAAVDASVGGKTGVNHPAGKNLIGVFHQPSAVIIDTDFLATLPQRDLVAGLAESVKHAVVRDAAFLDWHEAHAAALAARESDALVELIARNCAIKADVVARDEREMNLRAILNYGHTLGHAIEHLLGYELRHGECVALGMVGENEIACARGMLDRAVAERIAALLQQFGLPRRLPRPLRAEEVISTCRLDKKVRGGAIHFVLVRELGEPVRVADVSEAEIAAALAIIQPP